MEETGPDLIDYLEICWKRKWLILIPTLFLVLAAAAISFVLPKVWEVSGAILPSKILTQSQQGLYAEAVFVDAKQISGQIKEGSYNKMIADELKLDLKEIPKLKAENIKDTNLILISLRHQDVEKAQMIFQALIKLLKKELDTKPAIEINGLETNIKQNEIEITGLEQEIEVTKVKINITAKRKKEIEQEMEKTAKMIEALETDQRQFLKERKKTEAESLAMLLYSSNIQLNFRYYDELNELLTSKKMEEISLNLAIEKNGLRIKQLSNEMNNLKEKRGRIDFAQLIKPPVASLDPVSPKKGVIIAATAIISLSLFIFFAFTLESFDRKKALRP